MNVVQSQLNQKRDGAARAYSTPMNLSQSKRAAEPAIAEAAAPARIRVAELQASGLAPSAYTVLVSRLENRGTGDVQAVDELAGYLGERLARTSDPTLRRLAALPEYAAAGLTPDLATLPKQLAARLHDASATQPLLALLKHPVFAATMKDQQAPIPLYGPRGNLRAS